MTRPDDPPPDPTQMAALAAIVAAPVAWSFVAPLDGPALQQAQRFVRPWSRPAAVRAWLGGLEALGHTPATLADLEALGLVERWTLPIAWGGRAYTLSSRGAAFLGVAIVERWGYERTRERRIGPDGVAATTWLRVFSEEPVWRPPFEADRSIRLPRFVQLGDPLLPTPIPDASAPDPAAEARVAEAGLLIRAFEQSCESGRPDVELLRRAEGIVAGIGAAIRDAYVFDVETGLPRILMGRLVPRDKRMRRTAGSHA